LEGVRFYINSTKNVNGPSIFGSRLKNAIVGANWRWDPILPSICYIFAIGLLRPWGKNILRLDGLYFDTGNTLGNSEKLNRPILKNYMKTDAVIFQSEFNRTLFSVFMGEPHYPNFVICNGVPDGFSSAGRRMDYGFKKAIICSASWREHKRLNCIIKGFLEYGNPDVGLIIIGENVKEQIKHPNIKYTGRIPVQKLADYLRGGDAFIHLAWLDHCPNTVVEALACGLPVLCSHNGGTKEIVRSNGIIIQCEEDYNFRKVDLYNPPICNKRTVAEGIEQILNGNKPLETDYLRIENVAKGYMQVAEKILNQ
jgi:glycosyltransferase involved in cell wall biosynthesis